jgi:hypothetical protein
MGVTYIGTGNINAEPVFINSQYDDYRLFWISPCIDAGNPDPIYNDPDGTRADMGCYHYDQSIPVSIMMTHYYPTLQISPIGGGFSYYTYITNIDPSTPLVDIWFDVIMPGGTIYGPILGPVSTQLDSGLIVERERLQWVPANAPPGEYTYNAYAVVGTDTSYDCFGFTKIGSGESGEFGNWFNRGDSFGEPRTGTAEIVHPREYSLGQNHPNPFNAETVISCMLHVASCMNLSVYDVNGKNVVELVNGWRDAGVHEVVFNAGDLPSGIYFCRLNAGEFSDVKKMVLVK